MNSSQRIECRLPKEAGSSTAVTRHGSMPSNRANWSYQSSQTQAQPLRPERRMRERKPLLQPPTSLDVLEVSDVFPPAFESADGRPHLLACFVDVHGGDTGTLRILHAKLDYPNFLKILAFSGAVCPAGVEEQFGGLFDHWWNLPATASVIMPSSTAGGRSSTCH